jgi:hypothetical protein
MEAPPPPPPPSQAAIAAERAAVVALGEKRARAKRYGAAGQVFRAGVPVRGAKIRITTVSGKKLTIVQGQRRTSKHGHFQVYVRDLPKTFTVKAVGGRAGKRDLGRSVMSGFGRRNDPAEFVNLTSTLVVKYRAQHPNKSPKRASRIVANYLELPRLRHRPVTTVGQFGHVLSSVHDPKKLDKRVRQHGGVDSFLTSLASKIKPGTHIKNDLVPAYFLKSAFGHGVAPFPSPPSSKRASKSAASVASAQLAKSDDPSLMTDLLNGLNSGLQWMLQNAAQAGACALGNNNNVVNGLLACSSSSPTSADISAALSQMQSELTTMNASLDALNSEFATQNAQEALSSSQVSKLASALTNLQAYLTAMQGAAAGTPSSTNTIGAVTNPPSGINNLCTTAFAGDTSATTGGQTPITACEGFGGYFASSNSNGAPSLMNVQLTAFFKAMTGWSQPDANLVMPAVQAALSGGGTKMTSGMAQNQFNQQMSDLVAGQVALFQMALAFQSFYETWSTTYNFQPNWCPVGTKTSAFETSGITSNWGTSCAVAIYATQQLSVEWNVAANGAQGQLPSQGVPGTSQATSSIGVTLDTVASQSSPTMWYSVPLDLSGATLMGGNPWFPYQVFGDAPGQSTSANGNVVTNGPVPEANPVFYPTTAQQILADYPNEFIFANQQQTVQVAADALTANPGVGSINQALVNEGFIGAGATEYGMLWGYLGYAPQVYSFQTSMAYPGDNYVTKGQGVCTTWPPSPLKYPWVPVEVSSGYACVLSGGKTDQGILGTWASGYLDSTGTSTSTNNCPQSLNLVTTWGTGQNPSGVQEAWSTEDPTQGLLCTGPGLAGTGGFYGLLIAQDSGPVVWTQPLVTQWTSQTCIPTINFQNPANTASSATAPCPAYTPSPSSSASPSSSPTS